jgi:acetyl-CoA carboxylase biotin carboxyl carrier protein
MLDQPRRRRESGDVAILAPLFAAGLAAASQQNPQEVETFMARIEVKSEITGTVWQVKASPGDKVESGDVLVVIESMKMEIPVITEDAGTVKEILVKAKDPVAEGQVVAILEE